MKLTISLAASNQMSSLFGHSSQPFMMRFLAANNFPVTSSRRAEAIQAKQRHNTNNKHKRHKLFYHYFEITHLKAIYIGQFNKFYNMI